MSENAKLIPFLPAVEKWPTRKTPQARFDTSVQTAMNQMSGMVTSLNEEFIPTVNSLIDEINIVVEEQDHIRSVGANINDIIEVQDNLPMLGRVQDSLPMFQAVHDKMPVIEAAETHANTAKEYLEQVSLIASPGILSSSAYNIRKPFVVVKDLPEGSVLTLPAHYFPGRDVLFLGFEGAICNPRKAGVETAGEYQYTEIGEDPNTPSNQIVIHFDAPAGSVFDVWIVASAAGLNIQHTEDLVAEALQYQKGAEAAADKAATSASEAAESSAEAAAQADRATEAANRANSVVGTGPHPRVHTMMQDEDAPEGESLATPPYYPFVGGLRVFYDGLLLTSGIHYAETAAAQNGGQSSSITMLFDTEAGAVWEFHTWDSSAGDTPTQQATSLTQIGINETAAHDITMTFTPYSGAFQLEESDVTFYPKTL